MKWIVKIIELENYNIKTLWNDNIIRDIDLFDFIKSKTDNQNSSYLPLLDYGIFSKVKCDGTTLYWENLIDYKDYDGTIKKGNLDISPELLFDISVPMKKLAV